MLEQSIEDIREYVNSYRSNNNHEPSTKNATTEQMSDEELTKLLESDTINIDVLREPNDTKETTVNRVGGQNRSNVWKVNVKLEGLTLEIRESFYSKLNSALTNNYKATSSKNNENALTESNICYIAKKIEYGILSTTKDVNSYKLSVADTVVNIEKKTFNRILCDPLHIEIEILRLRNKMNLAAMKVASEKPQKLPNISSPETEYSSCEESQVQDRQSCRKQKLPNIPSPETEYLSCEESQIEDRQSCTKQNLPNIPSPETEYLSCEESQVLNRQSCTKPMEADNPNIESAQNVAASESEYFSCTSQNGHSLVENPKNSEVDTTSNSTHDAMVSIPKDETLENFETAADQEIQSSSTKSIVSMCNNNNNNDVEKSFTESSSESHSNNEKTEISLMSSDGNSQSKKRKREVELKLNQLSINGLPYLLTTDDVENTNKKQKSTESEKSMDIFDDINDNNKRSENFESHLKDRSLDRSDESIDFCEADSTIPNAARLIENANCEQDNIKSEMITPPPTDILNNYQSEKQVLDNLKNSPNERVDTQSTIYKSEFISPEKNFEMSQSRYIIKKELDISQYPIPNDKENSDESFWNFKVKSEELNSVDQASSHDKILQNPEFEFRNRVVSPPGFSACSEQNPKTTTIVENIVPNVTLDKSNHSRKRRCLIDEKYFDLERARLDKLYEELKNRPEELKYCTEKRWVDVIHPDYKKIFGIIIPVIRQYYPSEFIPDDLCYAHVLQRLQIDLTDADMSDDEITLYIKDSIKTKRYLVDQCMVQ